MSSKKSLLFIFLFCVLKNYAQVDTISHKSNHKIILSFTGGVAIPVGKFAFFETEPYAYQYQVNIAGVAKPGIEGRLSAIYMFSKHFGINGIVSGSVNSSDPVGESLLFYNPGRSGGAHGAGYVRESYHYSTESWHTLNFLTGLVYALKDKKNILQLRIAGGLQIAQSPETNLTDTGYAWVLGMSSYYIYPYNTSSVQPQLTSDCFVYNFGLDAGTDINNKLGILFSMDYLSSSPTFKGDKKYNNTSYGYYAPTTTSGSVPISFSKTISLLCFGVSLSYSF